MKDNNFGHGIVEFAAVFPVFLVITVGFMHVFFLGLRQWRLEKISVWVARELSLTSFETEEDLRCRGEDLLRHFSPPIRVQTSIRELPRKEAASPYRQRKRVEIIEVSLQQEYPSPFSLLPALGFPSFTTLISRVHEVRFPPESGGPL